MRKGLVFEEELGVELRKIGCAAAQCEHWDLDQKTDYIVTRIDGRRTHKPVELQITLQHDGLKKMAAYLVAHDRWTEGPRTSLYVEVEAAVSPVTAAAVVKRFALASAEDYVKNLKKGVVCGVRISADGSAIGYDLRQRARDILAAVRASLTSPDRVAGQLIEARSGGYLIRTDDGTLLRAYPSDIVDLALLQRVNTFRAAPRPAPGPMVTCVTQETRGRYLQARYVIGASHYPPHFPFIR